MKKDNGSAVDAAIASMLCLGNFRVVLTIFKNLGVIEVRTCSGQTLRSKFLPTLGTSNNREFTVIKLLQ